MAISAALYVLGDALEPARVTSLLGVEPKAAWSKGDIIPRPHGEAGRRRKGGWTLRIHAETRDPGAALRQLLDQLDERVAQVRNMADVDDAYFDLFMSQQHGSPEAFIELSPETLADLHRSGLPLCITVSETSPEG